MQLYSSMTRAEQSLQVPIELALTCEPFIQRGNFLQTMHLISGVSIRIKEVKRTRFTFDRGTGFTGDPRKAFDLLT